MLTSDPIVVSVQGVDAAKTFLRLDGDGDDAVVAALLVAAIAQCECFMGLKLMRRGWAETLTAERRWQVLTAPDVVAITDVTAPDGTALPPGSYETDIGTDGLGRVRATGATMLRMRIAYEAGIAEDWDDIPEPVRMGIVRLVAFYHGARDAIGDPGTPRGVTALWQASRRMRLQ